MGDGRVVSVVVKPGRCPVCGSLEIDMLDNEMDTENLVNYMTCRECGLDFCEAYNIKYSFTEYTVEPHQATLGEETEDSGEQADPQTGYADQNFNPVDPYDPGDDEE